jgi:hypothetical protein
MRYANQRIREMTANETTRRLGKELRRETEEVLAAPLPQAMQELLEKLEQRWRAGHTRAREQPLRHS